MKEFLNPENKQFKDLDDDQMLAVIKAKIANRLLFVRPATEQAIK